MYDDIIGPPCQVPYNTLLWGKKSPSNMTGAGGSCTPHCCRHRIQPSSLEMSKQSMSNHPRCHGDWLDSNILSIYACMIYTLQYFSYGTSTQIQNYWNIIRQQIERLQRNLCLGGHVGEWLGKGNCSLLAPPNLPPDYLQLLPIHIHARVCQGTRDGVLSGVPSVWAWVSGGIHGRAAILHFRSLTP